MTTIKIKCNCCGKKFDKLKSEHDRQLRKGQIKFYCNSKCSAIDTQKTGSKDRWNKNRIEKHSRIMKEWYTKHPKQKTIKIRYCKNCKIETVKKKYKSICDKCKFAYYKFYRPLCEFKFSLSNYKKEFNFSLIDKFGWYSPKNKKNNLNGIARDHLFSVNDGFLLKVDPKIISHPANCRLVLQKENQHKRAKSEITLNQLMNRIDIWNKKYKIVMV